MPGEQKHIIQRIRVDFQTNSKDAARNLQAEFSRVLQESLIPILEDELDAQSPPGTLHQIDSLEIDLGSLRMADLEEEMITSFRQNLMLKLNAHLQTAEVQTPNAHSHSPQATHPIKTGSHGLLEQLHFYLAFGQMPWWAEKGKQAEPEILLELALQTMPAEIAMLLGRLLAAKPVRERLVFAFPESPLKKIFALLKGKGSAESEDFSPAKAAASLEKWFFETHSIRIEKQLFTQTFWEKAFETLSKPRETSDGVFELWLRHLAEFMQNREIHPDRVENWLDSLELELSPALRNQARNWLKTGPKESSEGKIHLGQLPGSLGIPPEAIRFWQRFHETMQTFDFRKREDSPSTETFLSSLKNSRPEGLRMETPETFRQLEAIQLKLERNIASRPGKSMDNFARAISSWENWFQQFYDALTDPSQDSILRGLTEEERAEIIHQLSRDRKTLDLGKQHEKLPADQSKLPAFSSIRAKWESWLSQVVVAWQKLPEKHGKSLPPTLTSLQKKLSQLPNLQEVPLPAAAPRSSINSARAWALISHHLHNLLAEKKGQTTALKSTQKEILRLLQEASNSDSGPRQPLQPPKVPKGKISPLAKPGADHPDSGSGQKTVSPNESPADPSTTLSPQESALNPEPGNISASRKKSPPDPGQKAHEISPPVPQLELPEALYPSNAGLILVWPYLTLLLERFALLEDGKFPSPEARMRAVLLLQHLVTGETRFREAELPLNKLLCGVPLEAPLPLELDLSESEIAEIEGFFMAVIEHSGIWQNLSIADFRAAWLQREGILKAGQGHYQLNVEGRPYDVLLARLPWGINLVKFPWMNSLLMVEWT